MQKTFQNSGYDPLQLAGKIVNFGAFGLLVIFSLWAADDFYRLYCESADQHRLLAESEQQELLLQDYRETANEISEPIAKHQQRIVNAERLPQIQDQLVRLAKEKHCNLKKSTPKGHNARPLGERGLKDELTDLLHTPINEADFVLHQEVLAINLEGSLENLSAFMRGVAQQNWLCSTDEMTMYQRPDESDYLVLELELTFHDVVPKKNEDRIALENEI